MFETNHISKILEEDYSDPKTRIIKAAIEEFALNSVECARIRKITDSAGVNVAAVNYHFNGKEELYNTIVAELAEYVDKMFAPYYEQSKEVLKNGDAKGALALITRFIMECVDHFGKSRLVAYVLLIYSREEVAQSAAFESIYKSMYESPMKMLVRLMQKAGGGRVSRQSCIVFSHSIWSNVRSYCAMNSPLMRIHGWKKIGAPELETVKSALEEFLNKTLKK